MDHATVSAVLPIIICLIALAIGLMMAFSVISMGASLKKIATNQEKMNARLDRLIKMLAEAFTAQGE